MRPTLHSIRFYNKYYHPKYFKGFLGFVIRALNRVRYFVELFIQFLVFRYFLRTVSAGHKRSFQTQFYADVKAESVLHENQSSTQDYIEHLTIEPGRRRRRPIVVNDSDILPFIARHIARGRSRTYTTKAREVVEDFQPVKKTEG